MPTPLNRESIIKLLETNDLAVARAVVVINRNQTADEQASKLTKHHNGMGFRPVHAVLGTSCATYFQRNGFLSAKQIAYWRKRDRKGNMRIGIYSRQLIEAAQAKQLAARTVAV